MFMQNELQVSLQQKKLGEPIIETLFGKTVSVLIPFGKQNNIPVILTIFYSCSWLLFLVMVTYLNRNGSQPILTK